MPPLWPLTRALRRLAEPRAALAAAGRGSCGRGLRGRPTTRRPGRSPPIRPCSTRSRLRRSRLGWCWCWTTCSGPTRPPAGARPARRGDPPAARCSSWPRTATPTTRPLPLCWRIPARRSGCSIRCRPTPPRRSWRRWSTSWTGGGPAGRRPLRRQPAVPAHRRPVAAEQLRGRAAWQDPATAPASPARSRGAPARSGHRRRGRRGQRGRPPVPDWLLAGCSGWPARTTREPCSDPRGRPAWSRSDRPARSASPTPSSAMPSMPLAGRSPDALHGRAAELLEPEAVGHDGGREPWPGTGYRRDGPTGCAVGSPGGGRGPGRRRLRRGRAYLARPSTPVARSSRSTGPSCCSIWRGRAIWRAS